MPSAVNPVVSSQNRPVPPESTNPPNSPVQSSTYSLPNFDCVYKGGQCIHEDNGERCTNGYLSFINCSSGQCCKFRLKWNRLFAIHIYFNRHALCGESRRFE